jgi:hypothetical protein
MYNNFIDPSLPSDNGSSPPYDTPPNVPAETIEIFEDPTPKFQGEAFEYITDWCRASRVHAKNKESERDHLIGLYGGEIGSRDWQKLSDKVTQTAARKLVSQSTDDDSHLSNYVHPCAPYVITYAVNAYTSIFSGPDYIAVKSEDVRGGPTSPTELPTADKLAQLLKAKLKQGGIHHNILRALIEYCAVGTIVVKPWWFFHEVKRWRWNLQTEQREFHLETVRECPIIEPVALDKCLLDTEARTTDVQLWRGIGNRVLKQWADIDAGYADGIYTLNEKKFRERWKPKGGNKPSTYGDDLHYDPDKTEDDETTWIELWEWHGKVPSSNGYVECMATIADDPGIDDPKSGLLIKLTTAPVLSSGLRPYAVAHFTPPLRRSPFGRGLLHDIYPTIYQISEMTAQLQDHARFVVNAELLLKEGSRLAESYAENGRIPGGVHFYNNTDEMMPPPNMSVPTHDMREMIQDAKEDIQRVASSTDTFQGMTHRETSATAANIQFNQGALPTQVRTDQFCRNIMDPALNISLGMLQQFILADQTIQIHDYDGQERPIVLSAADLQNGRYTVSVTLTDQDAGKIAKAQSFERAMDKVPALNEWLLSEGWKLSPSEFVNRWLDLLDIDGADRLITKVSEREQILMEQVAALSEQLAMISGQMPQGGAPGSQEQEPPTPDQPMPLIENGGPMGEDQTDLNALAQMNQMNALDMQGGGM